mmetsp:Transcript_6603/g.10461  ORF Transcript_6603/g.10461 Transcript_6603/m.10461 type:complete len:85 (-) Transcript_6603:157-411(-)
MFKGNFWKNPVRATLKPIGLDPKPHQAPPPPPPPPIIITNTNTATASNTNVNGQSGCGQTNHNFQWSPDGKRALCSKCGFVIGT